jgi:hypothetical protein
VFTVNQIVVLCVLFLVVVALPAPANVRVEARNCGASVSFDPVQAAAAGGTVSYKVKVSPKAAMAAAAAAAAQPAQPASPPPLLTLTKDPSAQLTALVNGQGIIVISVNVTHSF